MEVKVGMKIRNERWGVLNSSDDVLYFRVTDLNNGNEFFKGEDVYTDGTVKKNRWNPSWGTWVEYVEKPESRKTYTLVEAIKSGTEFRSVNETSPDFWMTYSEGKLIGNKGKSFPIFLAELEDRYLLRPQGPVLLTSAKIKAAVNELEHLLSDDEGGYCGVDDFLGKLLIKLGL